MRTTKICAVQFQIYNDFNKNISRVEHFFEIANKNNCDIICFPEVFLTAGMQKKKYNPEYVSKSKKLFSKLSKNYNLYSIMGSIIEKNENNLYNISYLFDNKGKILGDYKKNHLTKNEQKYLRPDDKIKVFKTKIGNIGIQICRDLLYPEITRKLMLRGAEIVFCPSFWCSKSTQYSNIYNYKYFNKKIPNEVTSLASARAIESETVFVYVNAAGTFNYNGAKNTLLGRTQIALPFYGTTHILNHNKESVLIKGVDLSMIKDAKKIYGTEKDLKNYYRN
ncbi:MAG TPA: carbon-nitrogen hydrolase family protein [Candidatus Nanoarchaeia archaeon]|nr:carbon-nitrogen hydrolase family protein [Candidatus Nanoarchaeia archaeon]